MTVEEKAEGYDFSGEYAAPESVLRENLAAYGEPSVCTIHSGWFADTIAKTPVQYPVRLAYIDCDLAKGTKEVLLGVVPSLADNGSIFTQDFHIKSIQTLLDDDATWECFGRGKPTIQRLGTCLARIRFIKPKMVSDLKSNVNGR